MCLKEEYKSIKILLEALKYDVNSWEVIGDLKIMAFLMGLLKDIEGFLCDLCL